MAVAALGGWSLPVIIDGGLAAATADYALLGGLVVLRMRAAGAAMAGGWYRWLERVGGVRGVWHSSGREWRGFGLSGVICAQLVA